MLALSVLVASASAGAFNQYVEADSDRLMARTRRPRLRQRRAAAQRRLAAGDRRRCWRSRWRWRPGSSTCTAAGFVLLGAFTYAVVYTLWLKRRTPWNIVVGGLAGSFAVLAGAAAANPQIGPLALLLALVLFLWTPPHFWSLAIANEADYAAAGVPMLPVVVGAARAARIVHAQHGGAGGGVAAAGLLRRRLDRTSPAHWLGGAHFLRKTHGAGAPARARKTAMAAFFASMVQLSVLLAAVAVDAALR